MGAGMVDNVPGLVLLACWSGRGRKEGEGGKRGKKGTLGNPLEDENNSTLIRLLDRHRGIPGQEEQGR